MKSVYHQQRWIALEVLLILCYITAEAASFPSYLTTSSNATVSLTSTRTTSADTIWESDNPTLLERISFISQTANSSSNVCNKNNSTQKQWFIANTTSLHCDTAGIYGSAITQRRQQQSQFTTAKSIWATETGLTLSLWWSSIPTVSTQHPISSQEDESDLEQELLTIRPMYLRYDTTTNSDETATTITSINNSITTPDISDDNQEQQQRCNSDLVIGVRKRDGAIYVRYRSFDSQFASCSTLFTPGLTTAMANISSSILSPTLHHVVVILQNGIQQLFVNGILRDTIHESFANDLSDWSKTNTLHFLDASTTVTTMATKTIPEQQQQYHYKIHQLDVFKNAIIESSAIQGDTTATIVKNILHIGLPISQPYAHSQEFTVYEDGEAVPMSHSLEWYQIPPNPSAIVSGTTLHGGVQVGSLDVLVQQLLQSNDAILKETTATIPNRVSARQFFTYLCSAPTKGNLTLNGVALANDGQQSFNLLDYGSMVQLLNDTNDKKNYNSNNELAYIPPFNANGYGFDKFEYCVSEVSIFHRNQCCSSSNTATVAINVVPVNDPPIAVIQSPSPFIVYEGMWSDKVPLHGIDVDTNDFITSIAVTTNPKYGTLRLAVPTFQYFDYHHGTMLSEIGNSINSTDTMYVQYRFDASLIPPGKVVMAEGSDEITNSDGIHQEQFSFRVHDNNGAWSIEQDVTVRVVSAIYGNVNESIVTVYEDSSVSSSSRLWWNATDKSGIQNRNLMFFVEHIPAFSFGQIFEVATNTALQEGSVIPAAANASCSTTDNCFQAAFAELYFRPHLNSCMNANNITDGKISFRVIGQNNETGNTESISAVVSQYVQVLCVPDYLTMTVPQLQDYVITESSFHNYHIGMSESSSQICTQFNEYCAVIEGVKVAGPDVRTEKAWVSISTYFGYISFMNNSVWNDTMPITGRQHFSSGTIVVRIFSENISDLLHNLQYQSYQSGNDTVEILIAYGSSCQQDDVIQARAGRYRGTIDTKTLRNVTTTTLDGGDNSNDGDFCQILQSNLPIRVVHNTNRYYFNDMSTPQLTMPYHVLFCLFVYPFLYACYIYFITLTCQRVEDDDDHEDNSNEVIYCSQ